MKIEILGGGCPRCHKLAEHAEEAARQAGVEFTLEKVSDMNEILARGVMSTPALVLDGEVVSRGKLLTVKEIGKKMQGAV